MEIFGITIPIFIFVLAGYFARRKGIIGPETSNFLSKTVYYFAFPAMTFRSIVSYDFASTFRLKLVLQNLSVTTIFFALSFVLAYVIKDRHKQGAFNMGCFRSNQGYMGLPIINGFYGSEVMSRAAIINGFDSALVIILSVLSLEIFRGNTKDGSKSALKVFLEKFVSFITNPFVLSAVLGIVLAFFKVPVLKFKVLDELLKQGSNMALPLALLSVGCSIELKNLKKNLKIVFATSAVKLVLMPIVSFVMAYFVFGFRGADLGMSVVLLSTPTSVSSYVMAAEMDADKDLMATIIGFTTFASILTITVIQFVLKTFFI